MQTVSWRAAKQRVDTPLVATVDGLSFSHVSKCRWKVSVACVK